MTHKFLGLAAMAIAALPLMAQEHTYSLNPKGFDPSVSAKTDFYQHVNQGWIEEHPLTAEYARYSQFNVLADSSNNRIRRIITGLSESKPEYGTIAFKVGTLYEQGMDSVRRNQLGAKPIQDMIRKIESAKTPQEMEDLFIWMHKEIDSPLVGVGFQEDLGNSNEYAMYFSGASMGLGDRDYYLKNGDREKKVRAAYTKLIQDYMQLAGYSKKDAARIAKNVMKLETAIADSAMTKEQSRNIPAMYNPRAMEEVKANYPNVPWDRLFKETMKMDAPEVIIVTEFPGTAQSDKLLATATDREKKDLYLWELVRGAAPYLSDDFSDAGFRFNQVMSGVQEQKPRWKRSLATVEGIFGEPVGQLYVEQFFPQSSKDYMVGLVENLRTALGKHILNLPWMSDDTKLQAIKKLNAVKVKIGYPDQWKDISTLEINPELSYYENVHNANLWYQDDYLQKWGKPVDKNEWHMTPQTINAYYNPLANEIVFPAGILQAPYFDPRSSDAENYGGIGVVIGHELTHGFDDQGCNFNADGNMVNWWTPEDAAAFQNLTQGLVDQFNAVEILPGLYANGQYTLGENIADQGGLRVAYTAFLDSQKAKGVDIKSEEALIDGIDPSKVFYLNFANIWAGNAREEEIRNLTTSDVHSLAKNRVNVSLKNIAPFFEAFGIQEGDPMFRPESERVIIW